ncbi:MAG: hypothetical protein ACPH9E_12425 [Hyphomonas sp.]|jgi:hypothetical protein
MSKELLTKLRKWLVAVFGAIGFILMGALVMLRFIMDWVGRSTVVDDAQTLAEKLPDLLVWIGQTNPVFALILLAIPAALSIWLGFPALADVRCPTHDQPSASRKRIQQDATSTKKLQAHYDQQAAEAKMHTLKNMLGGEYPRALDPERYLRTKRSEIESALVSISKAGYSVPNVERFDAFECKLLLGLVNRILPFVSDGHFDEAKDRSKAMSEEIDQVLAERRKELTEKQKKEH